MLNDSFDFLKINEIKDFVISLEKLDIDVIYLELPTNLLENFFNDDYLSAYSQSLIELEKTNLIYSISDSLFSTENFRNIDHMNTRGSIITSNQVGKYLNEMKD